MTAIIPKIPGGILKLKTLCVGKDFSQLANPANPNAFPWNVWQQTNEFSFKNMPALKDAQSLIAQDQDIDLIFLDADNDTPSELTVFMTQVRGLRPKLPVIIFSHQLNDIVYELLRSGRITWPILKNSEHVQILGQQIQEHVFANTNWPGILSEYARENVKPRIEPSLSIKDLEALNHNPEEGYIIKRLFADSEVVQIFRLDEGFSGSRIYTVKPTGQRKRIVKIEAADSLETVREKQERLIQPRLDQRIGQIYGEVIFAQHVGGACYTLAGSSRETITLAKFLLDPNRLRREQIDSIFEQLGSSLERLYEGSRDIELRYWAPLYARGLPPELTLEDATLAHSTDSDVQYTLRLDELTNLSTIPNNQTLENIQKALRKGEHPEILLDGFVVSELDSEKGILYLHDDLMVRQPFFPGLTPKDHAILRFKIRLKENEREMLTHPIFRHGKRICVRGRVVDSQEGILARNISRVTGQEYDYDAETLEFADGHFIPPLKNLRHLLWEVGRNDVINPVPQISPVVHGDLNTSNILVEVGDETPVWLIDFAGAKPGHIYLDLAKLEVEFRTHILYRLFKTMAEEENWNNEIITKFTLLIENILYLSLEKDFDDFMTDLRDYEPDWYDEIDAHFPLYFENLIYFMFKLRRLAKTYSPERFKYHYPVALFFHSMTALKYENLDQQPWSPWSKWLALCCTLVSGQQALAEAKMMGESALLGSLRAQSAFALISIGMGDERKYLVQWNDNWKMFNLVGGKMNQLQDQGSFARTIRREIREELGIRPEDCRITRQYKPLLMRQFSKRDHIFKDYEFRLFQIDFLPKHPASPLEFERLAAEFSLERYNRLVSRVEIEQLITRDHKPISETTKIILSAVGEIENRGDGVSIPIAFFLDTDRILTSRGRAKLTGHLVNPPYAKLVEKIVLEVAPSEQYDIDKITTLIRVDKLKPGDEQKIGFWLAPKMSGQATVSIRATYYYDVKGREQQQYFELKVTFESNTSGPIQHIIDNPYVVGLPLSSASGALFVGREDVFTWIEENLIGITRPQTLILYGPRRMGKTSILLQLANGQRGQNIREYPGCPVFPVYFDLQSVAGRETRELLQKLGKQIANALERHNINVAITTLPKDESPFLGFDEFLDQVEVSLPQAGILIIMLDEFEQLQEGTIHGQLTPDIFPYLRSLMQHRPRIAFLLAGTHKLEEMSKDYWSTLLPIGLGKKIGFLNLEETKKLILEPVLPTIQYDKLAVEQIFSVTQGHPYFVQLICHDLISTVNIETGKQEPIMLADVKQTIVKILSEQDDHLAYLWNETTREEKLILAALSMHPQVNAEQVSRAEITARLRKANLSEDIINQALERLTARDLVKVQENEEQISLWNANQRAESESLITGKGYHYSITFDLFRQWAAKKHPIGILLP